MDQQQIDAITALLEMHTLEVEPGQRTYISSATYGISLYHLVEKRYNGSIQIEQIETDEKWSKRVTLAADEIPALLKTLLIWHLEEKRREAVVKAGQEEEVSLDDLDSHPF